MKKNITLVVLALLLFSSCDESGFEEPGYTGPSLTVLEAERDPEIPAAHWHYYDGVMLTCMDGSNVVQQEVREMNPRVIMVMPPLEVCGVYWVYVGWFNGDGGFHRSPPEAMLGWRDYLNPIVRMNPGTDNELPLEPLATDPCQGDYWSSAEVEFDKELGVPYGVPYSDDDLQQLCP